MKPYVLRQIETLNKRTEYLTNTGSGNKVLADNGEYINFSGSGKTIVKYNASTNNQTFTITPESGTIYLINSSSYTGIKVTLNASVNGQTIDIKNSSADKTITFTTPIDGETDLTLNGMESLTLIYIDKQWLII